MKKWIFVPDIDQITKIFGEFSALGWFYVMCIEQAYKHNGSVSVLEMNRFYHLKKVRRMVRILKNEYGLVTVKNGIIYIKDFAENSRTVVREDV